MGVICEVRCLSFKYATREGKPVTKKTKLQMKRNILLATLATVLIMTVMNGCSCKRATETVNIGSADSSGIIELNGVKAIWIKDNEGTKLMPAGLFADAPGGLIDSLGLQNGIPASVSTFLVESDSTVILFDTGLGAENSGLLNGLKENGIDPTDIKYIYLTHFHGDHIGGMMKNDSVVFPEAEVYASRLEYDAWMNMPAEENAKAVKTMEAYKENLHLFEFGDTLPGNVITVNAVGHTPGHTAYRAGKLLVIGDLVHGAALQLAHPEICAAYDMDKEQAIKTRTRLLQYARDNGLTMAGMHLPEPAFK